MDRNPKKLILDALKKHPEGLTIHEISRVTQLNRLTVSKYVYGLISEKTILERKIGSAKLCYLKKSNGKTLKIVPILISMILALNMWLSFSVLGAACYPSCQDCTGTDVAPCNSCDVNSMNVTVHAPNLSTYLYRMTWSSNSTATCTAGTFTNETWTNNTNYNFCPVEGQYNATINVSSLDGSSYGNEGSWDGSRANMFNLYTVNWDTDTNWCTCKVGSGKYNSSRIDVWETGSPSCCGDDTNENRITRVCAVGVCTSNSSNIGCCDASTDCVYGSSCYANSYVGDVDSDTSNELCSNGIWLESPVAAPTWANQGTNSTTNLISQGGAINLTAQGKDETALDWAWLSTNETGSWKNYTSIWWNTSFLYRKQITISNPSSALTDYQINLTITFVSGKMNSDFSDLRFVNSTNSELSYWIENYTSSTNATIWVKVPTISASTNTTVYMYYGSPSSTSESNGNTTFSFFDDFPGGSIDTSKWTITDPTGWSIASGELKGTSTTGRLTSISTFSDGSILEIKSRYISVAANGYQIGGFYASTSNAFGFLNHPTTDFYRNDGSWVGISSTVPSSTSLLTRIYVKSPTTVNLSVTNYNTGASYQSVSDVSNTVSGEPIVLGKRYDGDTYIGQAYEAYWDWIRIRNYTPTVPTSTIGSEQSYTYNSPMNMTKDNSWQWSNFTWQNTSIDDTIVGWKIYYNDTSNNTNGTNVMTFNVSTPPIITIQSPLNQSYATSTIWANATLNKAGSSCSAELDSATNYTMTNSTGNWNYQLTGLTSGSHKIKFYCNRLNAVNSTDYRYFYVDVTAPQWQNQGTNSTTNLISQGQAINLTAQGKDETALDWAWLSTNETGSWVNYTGVGGTGGTITQITVSGVTYRVHTFTSNGTFIPPTNGTVEVLVVAGGGGGGGPNAGNAGGGGAGGLIYNATFAVTVQSYTVTVGGGGAAGGTSHVGYSGGNSVFGTITSHGGGGGGYYGGVGIDGGSGGGTGQYQGTQGHGHGTVGEGNNGGELVPADGYGGGGGGGAGDVGGNTTGANGREGGVGGVGLAYSISGSSVYYAGGGGGSTHNLGTSVKAGGNGGGGSGQYAGTAGTAGTANTGGGGGGGGENVAGGAGGSGIVIIRYPISYNSLMNMTKDNNWQWSNFTWQNTSIDDSIVGWKIYYNDTSGNTNGTNIMTFTVSTPPIITIQSPLNQSYNTNTIWANVTLNKAGSSCSAELDSATNYTMTNSTGNWNYQLTGLTSGSHYVKFYCDRLNAVNSTDYRYFYVDITAPQWQNQGTNSTTNLISQGAAIILTAQGRDTIALDWAWLSTNETGSWVNYTTSESTVGTNTVDAFSFSLQRKTFYVNGLFWVFYSDGTNMVYKTSADGSSWSSATTVRSATSSVTFGIYFDGTYVHYAYASSVGGESMKYRRGTPNSDGTITWSAAEQSIAVTYTSFNYPTVAVDSSGYPWISTAELYPGVTVFATFYKSSTNDGTWSTAAGFPKYPGNDGYGVIPLVIPLTSNKMYLLWGVNGWDGWANRYHRLYGALWSGSSLGGTETIATGTNPYLVEEYAYSAVATGDDVHAVYLLNSNNNIAYRNRTYSTSTWSSEATVQSSTTSSSYPVLTVNTGSNVTYCFWAGSPSANNIYYKRNINGAWDSSPTLFVNASTNAITGNHILSPFYSNYTNKFGLGYMTKTSSPYDIRFTTRNFSPTDLELTGYFNYNSPMNMTKDNSWQWSNFTWQNSSIAQGTVVGWKIYYNDTSGNTNGTNIMTFRIIDTVPPIITIQSPLNQSYTTSTIWANVTLNKAGSKCIAQLDSTTNYTMTNSTGNWNYPLTSITTGNHHVKFYCNNTDNYMNTSTVYFYVDVTAPQWQNQGENATLINQGQSINLSSQGKDETSLDWAWLSTNETGNWVNYTNIAITTVTFNSSNSDGWIVSSNADYNTARNAATGDVYNTSNDLFIGQYYAGGVYGVGIGFVFFNTSSIPDGATIIAANLSLRVYDGAYVETGDKLIVQNGQPTYPHDPLEAGDRDRTYYSGAGGSYTYPAAPVPVGYKDVVLNSTGMDWISKTGTTKFALRHQREIDGNTPTEYEHMWWGMSELAGYAPQLKVTYSTSIIPMNMTKDNNWQWSNFTWVNSSVGEGTLIGWKIYYNDTSNNINGTNVMTFRIRETTPPKWYSNITSPLSPATYSPNQNYQFNITFNDSFGMSDIILEFNSQNYSYLLGQLSNDGQVYYRTMTDLAANETSYSYRWYGNDTSNNWNSTSNLVYVINKSPTSIKLYINGTEWTTDQTQEPPYPTEINATINVSSSQYSVILEKNGTPVSNPEETSNSLGIYNYTGYLDTNENCTGSSVTRMLTIQDTISPTWQNQGQSLDQIMRGQNVTLYSQGKDTSALDYAILSTNETGTWMNKTTNQKFEYYNTGDEGTISFYGDTWFAQTFTSVTNPHITSVTSVTLKFRRSGFPGTLTVSIRATDGNGHPTGSDLCSGTTDGNTVVINEWREIRLGAGCNLIANTKYAIILRAPYGGSSNSIGWRWDQTSPTYAGGNSEYSSDGGSTWNSYTDYDFMFEEWESFYNSPMNRTKDNNWQWSNFTWQNSSLAKGSTVSWKIYYNDTSNNINGTNIMTFAIINSQPVIRNLKEYPTDPAKYQEVQNYQFNITITDADQTSDISSVIFEWNGSNSTIASYRTINSTSREYYTAKSNLDTGTYNYKWFVNDTENSWATVSDTYTVTRSQVIITMNSTEVWWEDPINVSIWATIESVPIVDGNVNVSINTSTNSLLCSETSATDSNGGYWCNFTAPKSMGIYNVSVSVYDPASDATYTNSTIIKVKVFFGGTKTQKSGAPSVGCYDVPMLIVNPDGSIKRVSVNVCAWR